jgi:ubiquitin C-terminal hydrolase
MEKSNGLSGLSNLGNTCFINSCMQILSHTYELNNLLNNDIFLKKINNIPESILLLEWNNLRKMLWNSDCIISPGKFLNTIHKIAKLKNNENFTGYSQNDIVEFLLFIVDCFHTSVSREINMTITGKCENNTDEIAIKCFEMIKQMYTKEYSEIWNLFYAVHVSEIKSVNTNQVHKLIPEPYFIIDLPIPQDNKSPSLINCLDLYVDGEILENENAWKNELTGRFESVKKQIQFWSFPSILVVSFKRFNSNGRKNQILITFPIENLDLSKYVIGYKKNTYVYELYGICNHSGNVLGGHYTSYVKNMKNKWYHFNDTSVDEISVNSIITEKAYCLFYRKK